MPNSNKYIVYKSDLGELVPKIVLGKLFNLNFKKITRSNGAQTPDYQIENNSGDVLAICEVKTLIDTPDIFNPNLSEEQERMLSQKRDRNHRTKLRSRLGEALGQLKDYSDKITMVIFISFDMTDYIDLQQVLNDKEAFPASFEADIYMVIKARQDVVPSDKFEIKETARIIYNPGRGQVFSEKYMSTEIGLKNAGALPLVFTIR